MTAPVGQRPDPNLQSCLPAFNSKMLARGVPACLSAPSRWGGGGGGLADRQYPGDSVCRPALDSSRDLTSLWFTGLLVLMMMQGSLLLLWCRIGHHARPRMSRRGSGASTRRTSVDDSPTGPPLSRLSNAADISHPGGSHNGGNAFLNGMPAVPRENATYQSMNGYGALAA